MDGDFTAVHRAGEKVLRRQDAVPGVQEHHHPEDLVGKCRAAGDEELICRTRDVDAAFAMEATFEDLGRGQQDALFFLGQRVLGVGVSLMVASTGAGCASWGPQGEAVRRGRTQRAPR